MTHKNTYGPDLHAYATRLFAGATRPDLTQFETALASAIQRGWYKDDIAANIADVLVQFNPTFNRQRFLDRT